MGLDIRFPLGLLFAATGAILVVYGLMTSGSPIYAISMGVNVNLLWGAVMFVFGAVMTMLGRRK